MHACAIVFSTFYFSGFELDAIPKPAFFHTIVQFHVKKTCSEIHYIVLLIINTHTYIYIYIYIHYIYIYIVECVLSLVGEHLALSSKYVLNTFVLCVKYLCKRSCNVTSVSTCIECHIYKPSL